MASFVILLCVPFSIFIGLQIYRNYHGTRWCKELHLYPFIASCFVMSFAYPVFMFGQMADQEIRNGVVTSKNKETVSCSHSYECNCSGTGSKRTCSTCYEHSHDYDWVVHSNIPYDFTIDRIDRQGKKEPPRWTTVKIGDPVSDKFTYVNYVKGAHNSLFNKAQENVLADKVPDYPKHVYDYYNVDRVVGVGFPIDPVWNKKVQSVAGKLGPQKQVNPVFILTTYDEDFARAVEQKWLGGKKNDVVVIVQIDDAKKVVGSYIISWSDGAIFNVELRDEINNVGDFNFETILTITENQILKNFTRKHMADYSYLKFDIQLDLTDLLIVLGLGLAAYGGMLYTVYGGFDRRPKYRSRY